MWDSRNAFWLSPRAVLTHLFAVYTTTTFCDVRPIDAPKDITAQSLRCFMNEREEGEHGVNVVGQFRG